MSETKKSNFEKVLSKWDIIVIAFGAMIGWGWVVSSGNWISTGGVVGAALGFVIGGTMVFFVGRTYAELTSAMPQCGGEHVFSYKAMGTMGSFVCTWAIILGYVSVVCFESCTIPLIFSYIYPEFLQGYLYSIAGFDIYASWLISAVIIALLITYINIRGTKFAAWVQTLFTVVLCSVGVLLVVAAVFQGDVSNLENQAFVGDTPWEGIGAIMTVAMVTPFFFIGFDVIPQAAEEIKVPLKKVGKIILLSIVSAVLFYCLVILSVGFILDSTQISDSMAGSGMVTADALAIAFNSQIMSKVVLIGGLCGIITSWNAFMIGGSRAIYSMADSYMIPRFFSKIHPRYKTPVNALLLIGALSVLAPFFGRPMIVWIVDAGNFGCCLAYFMVALSFLILRKKMPDMPRPYKVKHYKFVGIVAMVMSGFMIAMYIIPGTGATLKLVEWVMVGGWLILGMVFAILCYRRYGLKFGSHIDVEVQQESS